MGTYAETARLQRGNLDVRTRASEPEHQNTLTPATNWLAGDSQLGEHAEAVVFLRATHTVRARTLEVATKECSA